MKERLEYFCIQTLSIILLKYKYSLSLRFFNGWEISKVLMRVILKIPTISDLSKGLYIVKALNENNEIQVMKFIKIVFV
jgi:hypothetical protein